VYRNGYERGRLKTSEGVMEVERPQIRGLSEPYRSEIWRRFVLARNSSGIFWVGFVLVLLLNILTSNIVISLPDQAAASII